MDQPSTSGGGELEKLGLTGPKSIKQALGKAKKPNTLKNAVKKFQEQNGIKLRSLESGLKLLELHKIRRRHFYEQAAEQLAQRVSQRIRDLGNEKSEKSETKLLEQLERSFHLHEHSAFRAIVLETLSQLPLVPDKYLELISENKPLYKDCAVSVRQQIWLKYPKLFEEAMHEVIDEYVKEKRAIECATDLTSNFFTIETTKARRQWKQIQTLLTLIGDHVQLYTALIDIMRDRFSAKNEVELCSLRCEIIMAAHDLNIEGIVKIDSCHDFVWQLDACMRDKHIDSQQTQKLKTLLDSIECAAEASIEQLVDLCMISSDVHIVYFLCTTIVRKIKDAAINHSTLPREVASIVPLIKLVSLGCKAQTFATTRIVPPDTKIVDSIFFTKFLPLLSSLIANDVIRNEAANHAALLNAEGESVDMSIQQLNPTITSFLQADSCASLLWLHYTIDLLPSKKQRTPPQILDRAFNALLSLRDNIAIRGVWCHLLFHRILVSNHFEHFLAIPEMQRVLCESIVIKNLKNSDAVLKYQLLRLVVHAGFVIGPGGCRELMLRGDPEELQLEEGADEKKYRSEYARIMEKMNPTTPAIAPPTLFPLNSPPKTSVGGLASPPAVRVYPVAATPSYS